MLENKLRDINEAEDQDKEILNVDTDEDSIEGDFIEDDDDDFDADDGMDSGIQNQTDPQILKL